MTFEESVLSYYLREIIAGSAGGACGIVVGHPLDYLKVTQQSEKQALSTSAHFYTLLRNDPLTLFRGIVPPLINGVVYQSIMFPSYRLGLNLLGKPKDEKETLFQSSVAGLFAGLISTLGTSPLEVTKIKLQLDPKALAGTRGATTRQFLHLLRTGELYRGWGALAWRDGPGTAVYMASYHKLKGFGSLNSSASEEVVEFFAGGFAGVLCWLSILPFDTVKTRLQFDAGASMPKYRYKGLFDGISSIVKTEGVQALFSGWKPLCARAFPVNAVTFLVYERVLKYF